MKSSCCQAEVFNDPFDNERPTPYRCIQCGQPDLAPTREGTSRPTREQALQDSRVLSWRDMGDAPPADAAFYVAARCPFSGEWQVARVAPGAAPPAWSQFWRSDSLGLPAVA